MNEANIVKQIGRKGLIDIASAFYRQVPNDTILGPMYPLHDMDGAEERFRDFLLMRIAGETDYTTKRGHPRLRGRHMPFAIDSTARDRWLEIMDKAMLEAKIPDAPAEELRAFFTQIADFMRNKAD